MTLDSSQAYKLRLQILSDLHQEQSVDIDARFVKPIFSSEREMLSWSRSWNIQTQQYTLPQMNHRDGSPIQWIAFSKIQINEPILLNIDDDLL
jgi:hypothetical protein